MFNIQEIDGLIFAAPEEGGSQLTVIVDNRGKGGRIFKRNAMQSNGLHAVWLVGELNGVRTYLLGDGTILITDKDVYYSETVLGRLVNGEYDNDG